MLATTNGSAKVQIDTTVLLVGVKADMTLVEDSSLCKNHIRFFVDCSAVASPIFAGFFYNLSFLSFNFKDFIIFRQRW